MSSACIQTLMGVVGSIGFAILFGIKGKKLIYIALGSAAGWIIYLLGKAVGLDFCGCQFLSAIVIAVMAEIMARVLRTPVPVLLVPMLIPEIPGGDLYYTMYYLIESQYNVFGNYSSRVLMEAGAIALGIILVSHTARLIQSIVSHVHGRGKAEI